MCACGKYQGVGHCGGPGCEFPTATAPLREFRITLNPALEPFEVGLITADDIQRHVQDLLPHAPLNCVQVQERAATVSQPTPKGQGPDITPLVIADLQARSAAGTAKYGEPLRARNGRDPLVDAYQEALDLCQYLRQAIAERDGA